jgi:TRAP-type C4-dicarboxylate transport system substrate-binding protein
MLISMALWNSLPKDIQDILEKAVWEQAAFLVGDSRYETLSAKQVLKDDYGIQFTELPEIELKKLDQIALDMLPDWEAELGPDSSRIIRETLGARID